ncbi:8368_t:CDS:2, partial [Acaulospora morrowiae]
QKAFLNPVLSLKAKSWQSFENFVASFRCIKSAVIEEDELTTILEVHAGARLIGDIQFKNHNLQLKIARHQTDTKSKNLTTSEWNVDCSNITVDVRQFKHCIINAPGSPYDDAFLSLDQPGAESPNEIHQYKLTQKPISQEAFEQEHKKLASENDFFILFTTADNSVIKLPKRSGIVDGKVFRDYFGPFADRAYRSAMSESKPDKVKNIPKVNINTASLDQLCRVNQIEAIACYCLFGKAIIQRRNEIASERQVDPESNTVSRILNKEVKADTSDSLLRKRIKKAKKLYKLFDAIASTRDISSEISDKSKGLLSIPTPIEGQSDKEEDITPNCLPELEHISTRSESKTSATSLPRDIIDVDSAETLDFVERDY